MFFSASKSTNKKDKSIFILKNARINFLKLQQILLRIFDKLIFERMQATKISKVVNMDDYVLETTLGVGAYGVVKLARHKKTNRYSSVKIMNKAEIIEAKQTDHVMNQVRILNEMDHPFVVNFEGIAQDKKNMFLLTEHVVGGDIYTHLQDKGSFEAPKAAFYAAQTTQVFQYLHSKNIIYRNLKPEHVLVGKYGTIKLNNFEFAKKLSTRTFTLCGNPQYLAPEILLNQGHGKPVDWWTLGIFIYEMMSGVDPFCDKDIMAMYRNIIEGRLRFPKGFNSDAKSLVKKLVQPDLSKRYGTTKNGVDDIKNHPFFKSINFKDLQDQKVPAPYIPNVKGDGDISNYTVFKDSVKDVQEVISEKDPFMQGF